MMPLLDRVMSHVEYDTNGGCWLWAGHSTRGYGVLMHEKKVQKAHRVMWAEVNGPIPAGLFVCHLCDVRACCNPAHLWLGTGDDNIADMVRKGRTTAGKPRPRVNRSWVKLSEAAVLDIRSGRMGVRAFGRLYGVHASAICRARDGITWDHV